MFKYPPEFSEIISIFSPSFSKKVFERAGQLLLGSILTQGKRTVCSVLRTLGLQDITNWDLYHRVLSRAKWSALRCAQSLLYALLNHFCPSCRNITIGIDDTVERRWGPKIKARGIYHDAVRSTKKFFVKTSGLRWISVMLLSEVKWAKHIWALPFLTVLAPSQRYHDQLGKQHKTLGDWARQIALLVHRWLPDYQIIIVADGTYAIMELLADTLKYVCWITRFRMDARLHDYPAPYRKGQQGRPPQKGKRLPNLEQRLEDRHTEWQNVCFAKWYGQTKKVMQITSGKALWYRAGKALIPLRWVLIRDPEQKMKPIAIQSTNYELTP